MPKSNKVFACHKLIAETAKALAEVAFEALMAQDTLWSAWKSGHPNLKSVDAHQRVWIKSVWSAYIPEARATLAQMLQGDYKEELKNEIFEALLLDAPLMPQRANPTQLIGAK